MKLATIFGAVCLLGAGIGVYFVVDRSSTHNRALDALHTHLMLSEAGETAITLDDCRLQIDHSAGNQNSFSNSRMRLNLREYNSQSVNLRPQANGTVVITLQRHAISDQTIKNAQSILEKVPAAFTRQSPNTLTQYGNDGSIRVTEQMANAKLDDSEVRKILQSPHGALTFNLSIVVPTGADGLSTDQLQPHEDAPAFHTFVDAVTQDDTLLEYTYFTNYLGEIADPKKLLVAAVRVPPAPQLATRSEAQAKELAQALLHYSSKECG